MQLPPGSISPDVLDLLTGGRPLAAVERTARITLNEADWRECPRCGAVVKELQATGPVAVDERGVSLVSDAVVCLPCGCEIRR